MPARSKQGFRVPLPVLGDLGLPSVPELAGGPPRTRYKLQPELPYPPPPPGFLHSMEEWVTLYYLTTARLTFCGERNLKRVGPGQEPVRGETFFFQVNVPVLGVFAQTEATRIDFLLPGFGSAGYEGLCLDPITPFTHPDPALDLLKRAVLATQANLQLIWLDGASLLAGDFQVIEDALHGADQSSRARGV